MGYPKLLTRKNAPLAVCRRSILTCLLLSSALLTTDSLSAPIILNEYNAVGDSRYLATDTPSTSTNSDSFFGRISGNGGDWFEMVVITNGLNLQGWSLDWSYRKDSQNYGSGRISFTDHAGLANLPAGTLLTLIESPTAQGGLDTDLSHNPANDDWWINLCCADATVLTTSGTVVDDTIPITLSPGQLRVNNNDWTLTVRDRTGLVVFGPIGEGSPTWTGPGVNGNEVAMLRAEPSALITPSSSYSDAKTSSFGAPNTWNDGSVSQDFSRLRLDDPRDFSLIGLEFLSEFSGWRVYWNCAPGLPYLLQRRNEDDFGGTLSPLWLDLQHLQPAEAETWADDPLAGPERQRFYRVIQPAPAPADSQVSASTPTGVLQDPISLTLNTSNPDGIIHYTLDGREPTLADPVFQAPLALDATTALRASCFVPGRQPGPISSFFWLMTNQVALPIVSLHTSPSNLFDSVNGIFTYPDGEGVYWERQASLVTIGEPDLPDLEEAVGIEVSGGSSRYRPKKSIALKWRSRFGPASLESSVFPQKPLADSFTDLVLRTGGTDTFVPTWTLIRDPLLHALAAEIGAPHSACEFVQLYLNQDYWGLYTLRERINEDYVRRNFGVEQADVVKLEDETAHPISGDLTAWTSLNHFFTTNEFSTVAGLSAATTRLDLDAFTDYQILSIYAGNLDWPHNNYFAWRPKTANGRWEPLLWDADLTFGLAWWENASGTELLDQADHDTLAWAIRSIPRPDLAPPWLAGPDGREALGQLLWSTLHLRRLLENPTFRSSFVSRFHELLNTTLASTNIISHIDNYETLLSNAIAHETDRWLKEDAYPGQWADNLERMRDFARRRPDRMRELLAEHLP